MNEKYKYSALIAGSPGTGKTTVAKALCQKFENNGYRYLRIEVDQIRGMLSGSLSAEKEWLPIVKAIIRAGENLADFVVIEGLFYYATSVDAIRQLLPMAKIFLLVTPFNVALERNSQRDNPFDILETQEMETLYMLERPSDWLKVDANLCIQEVAEHLYAEILK